MNGDRERRLSKERNQLAEKREEVLRSPLEEGHAQGQAGALLWSRQREKRPGLPCLELHFEFNFCFKPGLCFHLQGDFSRTANINPGIRADNLEDGLGETPTTLDMWMISL